LFSSTVLLVMALHTRLTNASTCLDALQFDVIVPSQDVQGGDQLIGSQAKLAGALPAHLEAPLVLQGLDTWLQKADAEVASGKVGVSLVLSRSF